MLPPSVHPSGHALRFTETKDTAGAVDFEELTTCVQRIALQMFSVLILLEVPYFVYVLLPLFFEPRTGGVTND